MTSPTADLETLPLPCPESDHCASESVYLDYQSGIRYVDVRNQDSDPFPQNKVLSLFSGAGGLDLGLEMAGFDTVACVEIDPDCRATLAHNRPHWALASGCGESVKGDIRAITPEHLLEVGGLEIGEPALVVGGPPCQPFSNIGKKEGEADSVNGTLYADFLRVVAGCLPKALIFENVEGFSHGRNQRILGKMTGELKSLGYSLSSMTVNAADYGVPQQRRRFIILGYRGDRMPAFPYPLNFPDERAHAVFASRVGCRKPGPFTPWVTVRDALRESSEWDRSRRDYCLMNISEAVRERMTRIGIGENFKVLPHDMRPECWRSGKHQGHDTFGRMRLDRPAVTIRTAAYNPAKGMYIHPLEDRGLSTHEMAVFQSFPPEWEFVCHGRERVTLVGAGRQIGNAVPPLLGRALGLATRWVLTRPKSA
ncbi:MAG: DNA cytosine methyltransferase [Armatimonadetes bacterium]|nr:DNA cytosine methyltransferase [Armatimonadota bacterium]